MRRLAITVAAAALAITVAACGDEPSTQPTTLTTVRTVPHPLTVQMENLRECLGGKEVTRVDVFEPTFEFAQANGGGGFAVKVGGQQIEFLVLPTEAAAQTTAADVTSQLTQLQSSDPGAYAAVAATATQTLGNIVQIVPTGATSAKVNEKVSACAATSRG